jgi:hypothetical protein
MAAPLRIQVEAPDIEALAKQLGVAPQIVERAVSDTMLTSVNFIKGAVVKRTPVNFGLLRAGVDTGVRGRGTSIHGEVFAGGVGLKYGLPVERGRKPGKMPPVDVIKLWVTRKGIASGDEADQAAFLIARAIGRRGTKGAHMFERGFKASEGKVRNFWRGLPKRVVKQI